MFPHHLQHLEILLKCVRYHISTKYFYNISKSIEYLFVFKNISESWNCNVAIKYFAIFDKNISTIFQLQWNIKNIPDIFLQYSVLCGCTVCCYFNNFSPKKNVLWSYLPNTCVALLLNVFWPVLHRENFLGKFSIII